MMHSLGVPRSYHTLQNAYNISSDHFHMLQPNPDCSFYNMQYQRLDLRHVPLPDHNSKNGLEVPFHHIRKLLANHHSDYNSRMHQKPQSSPP